MNFVLTLNLPDAEQETVWLKERLRETSLEEMQIDLIKKDHRTGTMSGGMITNMLQLVVSSTITEGVKNVITFLFEHFKGKNAKLELSGKCPDTGREIKLSFETKNEKDRDQAIEEFERTYLKLCVSQD
jgi:hypothetical protein